MARKGVERSSGQKREESEPPPSTFLGGRGGGRWWKVGGAVEGGQKEEGQLQCIALHTSEQADALRKKRCKHNHDVKEKEANKFQRLSTHGIHDAAINEW